MDDYFGTSVAGVRLTGGHCLDVLGNVVGLPTKGVKSVSFASTLHLLGLILSYVHAALEVTVAVDPEKAKKWKKVERHVRAYLMELVTLLSRVNEQSVLCVLLKHI